MNYNPDAVDRLVELLRHPMLEYECSKLGVVVKQSGRLTGSDYASNILNKLATAEDLEEVIRRSIKDVRERLRYEYYKIGIHPYLDDDVIIKNALSYVLNGEVSSELEHCSDDDVIRAAIESTPEVRLGSLFFRSELQRECAQLNLGMDACGYQNAVDYARFLLNGPGGSENLKRMIVSTEKSIRDHLKSSYYSVRIDPEINIDELVVLVLSYVMDGIVHIQQDVRGDGAVNEPSSMDNEHEGEDGRSGDDEDESEEDDEEEEEEKDEDDEEYEEVEQAPAWHSQLYFEVDKRLSPPAGFEFINRDLFDHQHRSLSKLATWWSGSEPSGILCLPTGAGKTRTTVCFILRYALATGTPILWLGHRQELVHQAIASFIESGRDAGRPFTIARFEGGARKADRRADIVVGSLPTVAYGEDLHNFKKLVATHGRFGLVVVDECHHAPATTWKRLIQAVKTQLPSSRVLGLSATPTRTRDQELRQIKELLGKIIHEELIKDLIQDEILAKPVFSFEDTGCRFTAGKKDRRYFDRFGTLSPRLLQKIATSPQRNALLVKTIAATPQRWGKSLVYTQTIEQAQAVAAELRKRGVSADALFGDSASTERQTVLKRFRDGDLQVLINVLLFTEGTDLPAVQTVFIARPTRSPILFRQMVGRGLRGPKIGGTDTCSIVTYWDHLRGMGGEMTATSFTTKLEADEGVGLQEPVPPPVVPSAPRRSPEDTQRHERLQQALGELRQALLEAEQAGPGSSWAPPPEVPLLGWWEVGEAEERRVLPAFVEDAPQLAAAMTRLGCQVRCHSPLQAEESAFVWVPRDLFEGFWNLALRISQSPQFVDIRGRSAPEVRKALPGDDARTKPAAVGPTLTELAQRLLAAGEPQEAFRDGQATLFLNSQHAGELLAVFDRNRNYLHEFPGSEQLVTRFMLDQALAAGIPRLVAESLLGMAIRDGHFPTSICAFGRPVDLAAVAWEMHRLAPSQCAEALVQIHQAFFGDLYASSIDLALALLDPTTEPVPSPVELAAGSEAQLGPGGPLRALSIRQPWAELIMRGVKDKECRTRRTRIRERVYVYASLGRVDAASEQRVEQEHGIDVEALPRGVLVGTIEIAGCSEGPSDYEWHLRGPERLSQTVKPDKHPQAGIFWPF